MVTTIHGIPEVRFVSLYSSGLACVIVKSVILKNTSHRGPADRVLQKFSLAFPNREAVLVHFSRPVGAPINPYQRGPAWLRLWNFSNRQYKRLVHALRPYASGARFTIPVLAPEHASSNWLAFPRVAPSLNPLLQLTF